MLAKLKTALLGATMLAAAGPAFAALPALPAAVPQVTASVDESVLTALPGDRPAVLAHAQVQGALDENHVLTHVIVGLKRSPAMQAAFDKLTHDQMRPGTADYHNWISAADLARFAPAKADIDKTVAWLKSHNLTVNSISPSGMVIDASGRVGDFAAAFRTELHNVSLNGEAHIANVTAPSIPAALSGVVHGVVLHNFFPKPNYRRITKQFNVPAGSSTYYAVAPADFAKIYNLNPVYNGTAYTNPASGAGVTIALVEQTDIKMGDVLRFRKYFGLGNAAGTVTFTHPGACGDPGFTGDEGEAALDTEWSGATAPSANVIEASCPGSETTFGVETTLQNLVELAQTPATIYSISYGGPEASNGTTFLATWTNLVQEGAAQGISIMVSSGDSGASYDRNQIDSDGLASNGLASSEYVTSIGGTDFYDSALGQTGKYWTKNARPGSVATALSYIPEIPWNNSCASGVLATVEKTTPLGLCNVSPQPGFVQNGVGGTGGQSIYYAKPDWQLTTVPGVPNDGVRDQPDVSLFAANGLWGHFYLFCMSDEKEGGAPCLYTGVNSQGVPNAFYQAAGGTSFAAPAFAGVMAVISSGNNGRRLGNVAPRLYQLAQAQYASSLGLSRCNSTLGNAVSSACVFYNVTAGDNNEPCYAGTANCYAPPKQATNGVGLLTNSTKAPIVPSWQATQGYSLAVGLGTINGFNLLVNY